LFAGKPKAFIAQSDAKMFFDDHWLPAVREVAHLLYEHQIPINLQHAMDYQPRSETGQFAGAARQICVYNNRIAAFARAVMHSIGNTVFADMQYVVIAHGLKKQYTVPSRGFAHLDLQRLLPDLDLGAALPNGIFVDLAWKFGRIGCVGAFTVSGESRMRHGALLNTFLADSGVVPASAMYDEYPLAGSSCFVGFTQKLPRGNSTAIRKIMAYHTVTSLSYKRDIKKQGVDVKAYDILTGSQMLKNFHVKVHSTV
jgi:hypothetical protein